MRQPFIANFMFEVPEASMPHVERCCETSLPAPDAKSHSRPPNPKPVPFALPLSDDAVLVIQSREAAGEGGGEEGRRGCKPISEMGEEG